LENFSAQRAAWLFMRHPDDLDETQKRELALIREASPNAEAAYGLARAFMQMMREHAGEQLETWLSLVEESTLPELKSFAKGIQQDKAAVRAGLTLPWNNGPLEGHVNRLKLIKRSLYGRAKLRLLRQRVLRTSSKKRKSTIAHVA
jgi:transposase